MVKVPMGLGWGDPRGAVSNQDSSDLKTKPLN
jgi:hypothetical protein